jgi:hypothetical protein
LCTVLDEDLAWRDAALSAILDQPVKDVFWKELENFKHEISRESFASNT